jgi:hypothetical protein
VKLRRARANLFHVGLCLKKLTVFAITQIMASPYNISPILKGTQPVSDLNIYATGG